MRICVGIDAAKTTHWAVGIEAAGNVVLDRAARTTRRRSTLWSQNSAGSMARS